MRYAEGTKCSSIQVITSCFMLIPTFLLDCAQMLGKMPIDVEDMKIDLMSLSGHKIYGPKGVGALYVRRRPRVRIEPIFSGGGQERGLRSGTVPTALCVGMGRACEVAKEEMENDEQWVGYLSRKLISSLMVWHC